MPNLRAVNASDSAAIAPREASSGKREPDERDPYARVPTDPRLPIVALDRGSSG